VSQWRDPPPVVVLSGDEDFLLVREFREAVAVADEMGRSVEYVEGSDREELSRVLSSSGVLFQDEMLVVVERPEKVDVSLVLSHHEGGSSDVTLLLYSPGLIKPGSNLATISDELPKRLVARFEKVKPWDEYDRAVDFCVAEARKRGFKLPEPLAGAVVKNAGSDLGVLAFEIDKLGHLLKVEGDDVATPSHVKRTLGAFTELGPKPVVDALERREAHAVQRALVNMRRTHAGNLSGATLRCCAFVSRAATDWLHVASLLKEGARPTRFLRVPGDIFSCSARPLFPRRNGGARGG
jgi:hypothetical protein